MIARWFWAALTALVVIAIGLIFWQTGNRTTALPPLAQSPPIAPAAPTVAQAPASDAAAPRAEKEPAAASSATTVAQAPSTKVPAPTAEKEPAPAAPTAEKEPAPAAPTVTQTPTSNAAAPTAEREPAPAAPTVTQTPASNTAAPTAEKGPATTSDEVASAANTKATAELASLNPGFTSKDLVAALNDSVINFGSGSAEFPASTASFLQNAAEDLKRMPAGYLLEIAGYTDNTGDAAKNVALSRRRADAVRQALIKSGANPDMLVAKGYGSANPIASNDTPDGRLRNRRIQYRLLRTPDGH